MGRAVKNFWRCFDGIIEGKKEASPLSCSQIEGAYHFGGRAGVA
jgi:hypothetical protein